MPSPCAAETAIGSPSPSAWNSAASGMSATVSNLFAATITGIGDAAQQVGHLLVAGAHAGARVDDQHRDLRVGERRARLLRIEPRQLVAVLEVDAAGVDQREAAPVPLARELLAVARDARAARARPPRATA